MTEEDKGLILKDLCARLPYGVKVQYENNVCAIQYIEPSYNELCMEYPYNSYTVPIGDIKPYLRPMSNMTEEERKEYNHRLECMFYDNMYDAAIDWLNEHHFDYRRLIDKGLAIEAPEEMYLDKG